VNVPNALLFDTLTLHRSLTEIDLRCSVPMMKTHVLAGVTLGMKNVIGLYPGAIYQALRGNMHDMASKIEPSATAAPIVDMVRANKLGLVVIDGSSAMEGNGPTDGTQVPMETIIAGTNPIGHRYGGGEPHGLRARRDFDLHLGAQGRTPATPPGGDRDSRRTTRSRPARVRSACPGPLEPRRRTTTEVIDSSSDARRVRGRSGDLTGVRTGNLKKQKRRIEKTPNWVASPERTSNSCGLNGIRSNHPNCFVSIAFGRN